VGGLKYCDITEKERAITRLWNSKQYLSIAAVMHATIAMQLSLGSKRTLRRALMQTPGLEVLKLVVRLQKTSYGIVEELAPSQTKGGYRQLKW
jgi:hypothetical protein